MKNTLTFLLVACLVPFAGPAQVVDPFPKLTREVVKTPAHLQNDLQALTQHLTQYCTTDTEKAWVIYSWISRNIEYDDEAYQMGKHRINKNIRDIIQRGKAVCFGYATLFEAMCTHAGLKSMVISGYSKGTLTAQPKMDRADHAWNAVLLNGEWALLDVTWGSSILNATNDFVQTYKEGYFLTAPDKFVLNHLPLMPMWQLLDCPLQAAEFELPAEQILAILANRDLCFNYQDSIRKFTALPLADQKRYEAQTAYSFNPTPANQKDLGHAYFDFAGRLSDLADQQKEPNNLAPYIQIQEQALDACRKAIPLLDLFEWQKELYADLLINQTVALYIQLEQITQKEERTGQYDRMLAYLATAQQYLEQLPNTPAREQKQKSCRNYQEAIKALQMNSKL